MNGHIDGVRLFLDRLDNLFPFKITFSRAKINFGLNILSKANGKVIKWMKKWKNIPFNVFVNIYKLRVGYVDNYYIKHQN